YPVYAVAAIIFALLLAAGAGSYFSSRLSTDPIRVLRLAVFAIIVMLLFQISVIPFLFRQFLSAPFWVRLSLSILFLLPAGFFMGMPFPIGLTVTSRIAPSFLPWAWGMNGYATVVGSVLSVILALQFGFRIVLFISGGIYLLAFLLFKTFPSRVT
ncbi:MAG TPA: SAM-dependent methyltransferase, partial [Acidobacteriota bacterium]|nr:SAM-dependent methyltransferase [Acidobacteriota bacterium]